MSVVGLGPGLLVPIIALQVIIIANVVTPRHLVEPPRPVPQGYYYTYATFNNISGHTNINLDKGQRSLSSDAAGPVSALPIATLVSDDTRKDPPDNEIQKVSSLPGDPLDPWDVVGGAKRGRSRKPLDGGRLQSSSNYQVLPPTFATPSNNTAYVDGLRIEDAEKGVSYEGQGVSIVLADVLSSVRLFGHSFTNHTVVRFATESRERGADCDDASATKIYSLSSISDGAVTGVLKVTFSASERDEYYFVCVRENNTEMPWIHQGPDPWLRVKAYDRLLPFWIQALLISVLLLLSGLFAGLTLGLLALDRTDLKILSNTGSEKERNYARTILPLRTKGNYLLCSLVLGNVLVNSTLTILLDDLVSGIFAVMLSTAGIVIVGEIIPQAVCSRFGLAIGAKTVWVTKFIMFITFPLSYTFSVILDKILGEEIGIVYNREKLKELLAVTKDHHGLENEEVGIISGALGMKTKTVRDMMTKIESVFMLPSDAVLNFDTMAEIEYHGYSRIPIYEGERSNVVALINVKQLTLLDASDNIPLRTVIEFYRNQLLYAFENTRLDYMFRAFREGNRGHMAFVQRVNDDGPGDPYYETIGIVTMEDVLEELLQAEIMDESDVGKMLARQSLGQRPKDMPYTILHKKVKPVVQVPPSLALAAVQFLSASVEPFKKEHISVSVIQRLMKSSVVFVKAPKLRQNEKSPQFTYLYEKGKPSMYFCMILEGRVQVLVGSEKMTFEGGPFTCFGTSFLVSDQGYDVLKSYDSEQAEGSVLAEKRPIEFIPDYYVKVITDVTYFRLKYTAYKAAILASELERNYKDPGNAAADSNWEAEIEKVLVKVEED